MMPDVHVNVVPTYYIPISILFKFRLGPTTRAFDIRNVVMMSIAYYACA